MDKVSDRPAVAIVCPDSVLVDAAGSLRVLRCQAAAVRRFGALPLLFVAAPSIRPGGRASAAKRALIETRARELGIPLAGIGSTRRSAAMLPAWIRTALRSVLRRPFGPEADVDLARLAAPPENGVSPRPAAVIANYLPGLPVADALAPRTHQLLVLHDLPAKPSSRRFLEMLANRPALMTLNREDAGRLGALLADARVHSGLPIMPENLRGARQKAATYRNLADVFAACGARSRPSNDAWSRRTELDLLFVGGRHGPNIEGLRAFLTGCFLPDLAPKGVTLAIAGAAGDAVADLVSDQQTIACLGFCDTLDALYASARLVIAPLLSGTGTATKTLEAIEHGKPLLATRSALRGLGIPSALAMSEAFGGVWSERILALLADAEARSRQAEDVLKAVTGPSMEHALAHILPQLAKGQTATPLPPMSLLDEIGTV
ncbi:glycosyltransferase [Oricola nitratireducens]|uniref:glycosyltransferase n=1 Tax=Oricola nitratireducens TaxID=2775868 RepID=UPI0018694594|nr:glycosyltransferase [Oricola nitratireducens]